MLHRFEFVLTQRARICSPVNPADADPVVVFATDIDAARAELPETGLGHRWTLVAADRAWRDRIAARLAPIDRYIDSLRRDA